jgi:hypothetical protein
VVPNTDTGRHRKQDAEIRADGIIGMDNRVRYFEEMHANFPPDSERQPGIDYKLRV